MLPGFRSLREIVLRAVAVVALLAWLPGGALAQADPNLCVPPLGGLAATPTIDGRVDGDPGWNRAMKVNLKQSGGTSRLGIMQIGRIGDNLYIALEIEGTPTPNQNDLVVLGFSSTTTPGDDWRVHIFPFDAAGAGSLDPVYTNRSPGLAQHWRNSTTPTTGTNANIPAWNLSTAVPVGSFIGEIKVSRNYNNWAMEIRIPTTSVASAAGGTTAIYLPPSSPNTFKFYANVLSTADLTAPLSSSFVEDPWPQTVPMLIAGGTGSGGDFAHNNTPPTSAWATASTYSRDACKGVYLASNTPVGVRQNATSGPGYTSLTGNGPFQTSTGTPITTVEECQMLADNAAWPASTTLPLPDNFFIAKPGNDGTSAAGVSVKYYVAPWGIPGAFDAGAPNAYWHPIGELYRPASMTTTVHTTTTAVPPMTPPILIPPDDMMGNPTLTSYLSTPSWQLTYKQACVYTKSAYYGYVGHHCIHAEVSSTDPSVRIRNKSIQINHNFMPTASPVEREAMISLKGRGRPAAQGRPHEVILYSQSLVQTFRRDGTRYYPATTRSDAAGAVRAGTTALALAPNAVVPYQFRVLGPVPAERFPNGVAEGMTVITNAYVRRSNSLIIGSARYQRADYIGGYSYLAGSAKAEQNWTESIALQPGAKTALGGTAAIQSLGAKVFAQKTPSALPISASMLQVAENDTIAVAVKADAQAEGAKPPEDKTPGSDKICGSLKLASGGALLAAFGLAMRDWSGQDDLVVGTPGRMLDEVMHYARSGGADFLRGLDRTTPEGAALVTQAMLGDGAYALVPSPRFPFIKRQSAIHA
jgi:hypothetical protein